LLIRSSNSQPSLGASVFCAFAPFPKRPTAQA
jgi:hypothetical protein